RALAFGEVRMRGQVARRRTIHFGWTYGYESWRVEPGPPLPYFLLGLRARVAPLASVDAEALAEVLVTHYPTGAGIGWHRDAPAFGVVIGVSLLGTCRFRFQHGCGAARRTRTVTLGPRSAYVAPGPRPSAAASGAGDRPGAGRGGPERPADGSARSAARRLTAQRSRPRACRAGPACGAGAAAALGPAGHLLRRREHEPRGA